MKVTPDFKDAEKTFIARIVGCLRSGMTVADSLKHSASIGWVPAIGDDKKAWKWPGPADFIIPANFGEMVAKSLPTVPVEELNNCAGQTYLACTKVSFRALADSLLNEGINPESYQALKNLGGELGAFYDEAKVVRNGMTVFYSNKGE